VLRHSSPATQAWYVHEDPDPVAIVRAVAKVSYQRKDKQSSTPGLKTQGLEE